MINNLFNKNYHNPIILPEVSGNHSKSLIISKKIINQVSKCGVKFIKFQTFDLEEMTFNLKKNIFKIKNKKNIWYGKYYYDLYKKSYVPQSFIKKLFEYSYQKKLIPFSSVFDLKSLEFLEKINCKLYKIASFENTDIELIKNVAKTKKPIIISSGLANKKELDMSIDILKKYGSNKIVLLKCTSNYPAKYSDLNLKTISDMKKRYGIKIGFSDHTIGSTASISAINQGAEVIEKHICLKKDIGIDSKFSLTIDKLNFFLNDCENSYLSKGNIFYGATQNEKKISKGSRSLFFKTNLKKGTIIKHSHLKRCRPGFGLKIYKIEKLIGNKLSKNAKFGDPVTAKHFKLKL